MACSAKGCYAPLALEHREFWNPYRRRVERIALCETHAWWWDERPATEPVKVLLADYTPKP